MTADLLEESASKANIKAAFSEHLDALAHSLSLLFIRNNASGRNKFREKWPQVALYLFGAELISFDNEGTTDRERKAQLEQDAGLRRIDLKRTILEIQEKSVKSGMLELEYIGGIIDKFGPDLSVLLYAENVIERVRPGILAGIVTRKQQEVQSAEQSVLQNEADLRQRASQIVTNSDRPVREAPSIENTQQIVQRGGISLEGWEEEKSRYMQEQEALRNPLPDEDPVAENVSGDINEAELLRVLENEDQVRPIDTAPSDESASAPYSSQALIDGSEDPKPINTAETPSGSNPPLAGALISEIPQDIAPLVQNNPQENSSSAVESNVNKAGPAPKIFTSMPKKEEDSAQEQPLYEKRKEFKKGQIKAEFNQRVWAQS